jgi:hypothetical protein
MQAIFLYKDNICYKSRSILPLQYMTDVVNKMTTDSYKKIKDNIWIKTNALWSAPSTINQSKLKRVRSKIVCGEAKDGMNYFSK